MGIINGVLSFLKSSDNFIPIRGAALRVESSKFFGLVEFDHFGIYAGNSEVIHLTRNGLVVKESIKKFIEDQSTFNFSTIDIVDFEKSFQKEKSYQIAISHLNEKHDYSLTSNNCEHFVSYCRTGISYSSQSWGFNENNKPPFTSKGFCNIPRMLSMNNLGMTVVATVYTKNFK